jgi:hypothetical protein
VCVAAFPGASGDIFITGDYEPAPGLGWQGAADACPVQAMTRIAHWLDLAIDRVAITTATRGAVVRQAAAGPAESVADAARLDVAYAG